MKSLSLSSSSSPAQDSETWELSLKLSHFYYPRIPCIPCTPCRLGTWQQQSSTCMMHATDQRVVQRWLPTHTLSHEKVIATIAGAMKIGLDARNSMDAPIIIIIWRLKSQKHWTEKLIWYDSSLDQDDVLSKFIPPFCTHSSVFFFYYITCTHYLQEIPETVIWWWNQFIALKRQAQTSVGTSLSSDSYR